jgi:hypothetical protein
MGNLLRAFSISKITNDPIHIACFALETIAENNIPTTHSGYVWFYEGG